MSANQTRFSLRKWGKAETTFAIWAGSAMLTLLPIKIFLQGAFPVFTVIWLTVPLLVVLRTRDANRVGFRTISWRIFLTTAAINLSALLLVAILIEPWSHSYQALVKGVISGTPPDTTFAWLIRFTGFISWSGLLLYSGLVTIFGEELFFRGWLLQILQRRMKKAWAVMIQSTLFTIPQLLAAFLLTPLQGVVYAVIYSFLGIGIIGGWAATRTQSIWPSLASATIWNAIMVVWILSGG
jgi:membrane protease YdiL (CAAX protease family)